MVWSVFMLALIYGYASVTSQPPPPPGQCGRPDYQESRVVGGTDAALGQYPWQVALFYFTTRTHPVTGETRSGWMFVCGGSIIDPRWIVTAAHCVQGKRQTNFGIMLGAADRSSFRNFDQVFKTDKIIIHEDYNKSSIMDADLALMRTNVPMHFNKIVKPVCLPKQGEDVAVNKKCFVSGFGRLSGRGPTARILQHAMLPIVDSHECETLLNTHLIGYPHIPITRGMVCAGHGTDDIRSACMGDSGGPLVCQQPDGRWVLEGAVSFGNHKCETQYSYSVFVRMSNYVDWIDAKVNPKPDIPPAHPMEFMPGL